MDEGTVVKITLKLRKQSGDLLMSQFGEYELARIGETGLGVGINYAPADHPGPLTAEVLIEPIET